MSAGECSYCLGFAEVAQGGTVEISAKRLTTVATVRFKSRGGREAARPNTQSETQLTVQVPKPAKSGTVVLVDQFGNKARSDERLVVRSASKLKDASDFKLLESDVSPSKAFFDGKRRVRDPLPV